MPPDGMHKEAIKNGVDLRPRIGWQNDQRQVTHYPEQQVSASITPNCLAKIMPRGFS